MANEFIARRGLRVLDNGIQITGSSTFATDITASGNIKAAAFYGNGTNVAGVVSASYALTSSLALHNIVTASSAVDSITFTKGNGTTFQIPVQIDTAPTASRVEYANVANKPTLVSASTQFNDINNPFTGSFTGSFVGEGSGLTGLVTVLNTSGTTGTATIDLKSQSLTINGANGVTTNASGQTVTVSIPNGSVSSSVQVDVRNTTGIVTIATTGSNTFTGIQTISNTTNSTAFNNGALVIAGGLGVEKDVHISGSVTINGLLTAVSMSTQYVTSSEYTVGTSRIILNDDDNVRFGGISVIDSGSTAATGSILWDSLKNHWIYEREDSGPYRSAVVIAGPKNYGSLGDEEELVIGRVPVATGGDHIDTNIASSSIRIIPDTLETHIEHGLYVTGSVTASGFNGDGSNLTGIVTNLNITGSQGGTGTVALKTQSLIVSGSNGISVSAASQTIAVNGVNATTTTRGVASFNSTNFTVTSGEVTSNNITINGANVTLGGTRNITLAQITTQGASTADQVTLSGGAIIHGILYTSGSTTVPSPLNSVVATVPTGSYDAAHFDYVLKNGANLRTGTVMAVWQSGTANVEFTDTSTNDIGNTLDEVFTVDLLNGSVRLKLTGDSNTWTVKSSIRLM